MELGCPDDQVCASASEDTCSTDPDVPCLGVCVPQTNTCDPVEPPSCEGSVQEVVDDETGCVTGYRCDNSSLCLEQPPLPDESQCASPWRAVLDDAGCIVEYVCDDQCQEPPEGYCPSGQFEWIESLDGECVGFACLCGGPDQVRCPDGEVCELTSQGGMECAGSDDCYGLCFAR